MGMGVRGRGSKEEEVKWQRVSWVLLRVFLVPRVLILFCFPTIVSRLFSLILQSLEFSSVLNKMRTCFRCLYLCTPPSPGKICALGYTKNILLQSQKHRKLEMRDPRTGLQSGIGIQFQKCSLFNLLTATNVPNFRVRMFKWWACNVEILSHKSLENVIF